KACYKAIVLASEGDDFLAGTEQALADNEVLEIERLLRESEIPVVVALERNAKGKAWLISQCCDGCVYNQAGLYGAGTIASSSVLVRTAAACFASRLGKAVGTEILLTGAEYSGTTLGQRVGTLLVAEHDQVLVMAVEVAKGWARLPRATLAAWKTY